MTPPTDLPHRFVACKNWKWMQGMRLMIVGPGGHNEGRIVAAWDNEEGTLFVRWDTGWKETPAADLCPTIDPHYDEKRQLGQVRSRPLDIVPDIADPATLGCILARIRRLRNDPTICPYFDPLNGWALKSCKTGERLTDWHDTEEAAYLDGLENS